MAGIARQHDSKSAMSPVGQSVMILCPTKAVVVNRGPFSDGFHAGDSLATLDRANLATHKPVMAVSPKIGHDIVVAQTEVLGRPVEPAREVDGFVSGGFHAKKLLMTPGKADTVQTHSLVMVMSDRVSMGKAVTESDRVSMGLFLSNLFMSLSRVGIAKLGVQGGDEGGWVDFARVAQGIETPHQAAQLVVSTDCGYPEARVSMEKEVVSADMGLGDVDSSSPLMTITPLGLAVPTELNSGNEVLGLENTLYISNWVKHRLPIFSKMMGLSLGRHEEKCIKLL